MARIGLYRIHQSWLHALFLFNLMNIQTIFQRIENLFTFRGINKNKRQTSFINKLGIMVLNTPKITNCNISSSI